MTNMPTVRSQPVAHERISIRLSHSGTDRVNITYLLQVFDVIYMAGAEWRHVTLFFFFFFYFSSYGLGLRRESRAFAAAILD